VHAPSAAAPATADGEILAPTAGELAHLQARIAALESEVSQLRATVAQLCTELGLSQPGQAE
jgi:uncharacterized protein YceH (UPF0502 family)